VLASARELNQPQQKQLGNLKLAEPEEKRLSLS